MSSLGNNHTRSPASLLVFSDDWGRHPSSCQHLIKHLLPRYKVAWINTIGTRTPKLNTDTFRRVLEKSAQWMNRRGSSSGSGVEMPQHDNLTVVNPKMWPWFSRSFDRRLNAKLLTRQLTPIVRRLPQPVAAITTLPITADLPQHLPVQSWLYYCVDDFGEWPGLDGRTLRTMDKEMIRSADSIVCVSRHLQNSCQQQGRPSTLLTHGVDCDRWSSQQSTPIEDNRLQSLLSQEEHPAVVFWGVVDRRLDTAMIRSLAAGLGDGKIIFAGPIQNPDPDIVELPNVYAVDKQPFTTLPTIARMADVLVMPYADLPVTRAMQPLKMKEYMATGKPVVVSALPAAGPWADCLDVCESPEAFSRTVLERIRTGVLPDQLIGRRRLKKESWKAKAKQFEQLITALCSQSKSDTTNAHDRPSPGNLLSPN